MGHTRKPPVDEKQPRPADQDDLIAAINVPAVCLGPDLTLRWFTPAAREVLRVTPADRGRPLADLPHDFTDDGLAPIARRALADQAPASDEALCRDGRAFLRRASPCPAGVVVSFWDITARRQADLALRASEERSRRLAADLERLVTQRARDVRALASLIEASHDAIFARAPDGTITTWNPGAERLYGYTAREAIGLSYRILVPPDCRGEMDDRDARLLRGEALTPFETRRARKDGEEVFVSLALTAIRDETGQVISVASIGRDITAECHARSHAAFLNRLHPLFMRCHDSDALVLDALRELAAHLGVDHTAYFELADASTAVVKHEFPPAQPSTLGAHRFQDFSPESGEALLAGHEFVVSDVEADPRTAGQAANYRRFNAAALVLVPLVASGGLRSCLAVSSRRPRAWRDDEVQLLRDVAARLFPAVERARAEQALRTSERRLQAFLDNSAVVAWLKDAEGRYVFLSRNYETRFQVRFEDWRLKSDFELWPRETAETFRRNDLAVLETGRPVEAVEETVNPDGAPTYWLSNKFPFQDEAGRRYVGGLGIDITQRRLAEQALAQRAAQQAAVAALGQMALTEPNLPALLDEATRVVAAVLRAEFCKVLELLPDGREVLLRAGVGWREGLVGHATVSTGMDSQAGYTLASAGPVVVEDLRTETRFRGPPLLHDHGVISGLSCRILGPAGQPYGVLGAHATGPRRFTPEDVHFLESVANVLGGFIQREHFEEGLRQSERKLRAVVNTAADAIITIDAQGAIDSANPAAEQMFGYSAGEMIGRSVGLLMPSPYSDEHGDYIARYLDTGERHVIGTSREVEARRRDGSLFPVELAVSEVEPRTRFTGILRDITRRKELERDVVEIASQEQRRIGQDLHDTVGQELTALSLLVADLAEMLPGHPATALADQMAQGLRRSQQKVRTVIRGLLPVAVDAEGLMVALAELAARTQQDGKVTCSFDCAEPVSVADNLTATHLYLIAQEAARNALKHAQPQRISISLHANHNLTLRVRDDGTGLPARPAASQGLGLRIMRNRAAIIGAALAIEPARPHGTVIRCVLPRRGP